MFISTLTYYRYFDFSDFEGPVHTYIDTSFFWALVPGITKKTDIYVKQNKVQLTDDVIQILTEKDSDFYQIQLWKDSIEQEASDGTMVSFYFRFDSNFDIYVRQVYSFWDFLGQVGGLGQSLIIIGAGASILFTRRLFIASVIKKIYQVS